MKEVTLDDVGRNDLVESEQYLVNVIRARYPHLDIRSGTALRDLLITPDSAVHAVFSKQADELRRSSSLQAIIEAAAEGYDVDTDDVSRILSNFNLSAATGSSARGDIKVIVSSNRTYVVQKGFKFSTIDGVVFSTDKQYVISDQPVDDDEIKLYKGSANYFFIIPVTCATIGSSGNITAGTPLSSSGSLAGYVAASAYGDFYGGSDSESLSVVKSRIPVALSCRGLLTSTSIESVLRDKFDNTQNPIIAVSVVGYGNPAQLRDKHNAFGVGVGGRADIYVRNFTAPYTKTVQAVFEYDDESDLYCADVSVPGMYNVSYVSEIETNTVASYSFSVKYASTDSVPKYHDFDVSTDGTELAGTVWRSCRISVELPEKDEKTKTLSVGMICLPDAEEIQEFIDSPDVRNVGVDYVVRCPAVCAVSVNAVCRYDYGNPISVESAKSRLADYINTTGFVGRLTRSEIACVLRSAGAKSVNIDDQYMLTGYVVDAKGVTHRLSGDALDIDDIENPGSLLTKDTCVFSTSAGNINIVAVPS